MNFMREFRVSKGYSLAEMAKILDVSQSLYEKIEYGDRHPSRNFMMKVKDKFPDFDMNIFFTESIHEMCRD